MSAITTSFLIYANSHHAVICFCVAVAIGSKYLFRVKGQNGRYVHFFNPSNFGIAVTLFVFPWVSIIPYAFLEHVKGPVDIIVPCVILLLGTRLNVLFTKRVPLILTWFAAFIGQAVIRDLLGMTPLEAGLSPMTGVAFVLFSFYMITDPMTSPSSLKGQITFGISLAAAYAFLMAEHIIFTLFYAVFIVTGLRGVYLWVENLLAQRAPALQVSPAK